ncbi:hypothetical protein SPF06_07975 [Sinomonas sp. JGH33]|uniref:SHOCT domain-containing protein n=1 Tax=Sinomonas terricola TaxID=3110330 RepID=A0ABU5T4R4_9MICC|nr:hypothetical protein [Sinomonas sp. JGH33]MEA5454654.1 hypothetical protein [Sinomonas sp. JGH33]
MSWFFWVIVFAWVIPIIMRRMGQSQRGRQIPPRDRGYNRYGGYPGNPYPRGVPGTRPPQTGQRPAGQQPAGQNPGTQQGQLPPPGGENWWEHPIPPGSFPGQQIPRQPSPQAPRQQAPAPQRAGTPPSSAAKPPPPVPEAQGYRARKLAELDQQFTDQKISLEEYMKARNEIMRG